MKLYMVPLAPNPTKVMLYIAEREQLGRARAVLLRLLLVVRRVLLVLLPLDRQPLHLVVEPVRRGLAVLQVLPQRERRRVGVRGARHRAHVVAGPSPVAGARGREQE